MLAISLTIGVLVSKQHKQYNTQHPIDIDEYNTGIMFTSGLPAIRELQEMGCLYQSVLLPSVVVILIS